LEHLRGPVLHELGTGCAVCLRRDAADLAVQPIMSLPCFGLVSPTSF